MDQMKICPKCGQVVKSEALKCRYCGYWFNTVTGNEAPPPNSSVPPQQPTGQQGGGFQNTQQQNQQQQWQQQQSQQQQWQQQQQQSQQQQWQQQQQSQQQQWQQQSQQQQWQQGNNPYPQQRLLTVGELLTEGSKLGLANFLSIFLAYILWGLTCWIPYLNVGTTIGLINLPINLSKSDGSMISPTAIFDGKYRKYMGEFFSLTGLMMISLIPAFFFMIVPAIIIGYGWSQAYYLMFDKETSPSDAMLQSTKITYGYKSTLFFAELLIGVIVSVVWALIGWLCGSVIGSMALTGILGLILFAAYSVIKVGMAAIAYRKLSTRLEE